MEFLIFIKLLALLIAAISGALLEASGLQLQVPDGWRPATREATVPANPAQRMAAGFLLGCIYVAYGCGFGSCDVLTANPGPPLTVAVLVGALVSGFLGARFARLGVRVPILKLIEVLTGASAAGGRKSPRKALNPGKPGALARARRAYPRKVAPAARVSTEVFPHAAVDKRMK